MQYQISLPTVAHILFVGTKKQAQDAIQYRGRALWRCSIVNERWLRWYAYKLQDNPEPYRKTERDRDNVEADGTFDVLPKKEVIAA